MVRKPLPPPLVFSYLRFSDPEQSKGDSVRRQVALRDAFVGKIDGVLDTTLKLRDEGVSAFTGAHRKNPDRHALAAFLELARRGRIPRGAYLVVENLDRLSREDIRPALTLLLNLIEAGIRVVQLLPVEAVYDEDVQPMQLMMAIMELSRGHSESAMKAERNGAAWQNKLAKARDKKEEVISERLPAWIEIRDGKKCLIPERAAVVKRIFTMTANGYGIASVVKRLTEENVPPFGGRVPAVDDEGKPVLRTDGKPRFTAPEGKPYGAGVWVRAYVAKILKDRRALGEYQPCGKGRKPAGEPIPGYFPAVVTPEEWHAVREGAAERRRKPGRVSKRINLFAGLVRDARDGETYFEATVGSIRQRVLVNNAGAEGRAKYRSFPAQTFEEAVFSLLREIDPHEILNGDQGPDQALVLAGQLAQVESKIAELEAELLNGDVAALAKVLRLLEGQKRELAEQLAEARRKATHRLSATWGEAQSLLTTLNKAPDPEGARLRLRSLLRQMVDVIWLLVVPRGRDRLAAIQVWFTGERRRNYLILRRGTRANASARQEGSWAVHALPAAAALDLRQPAHTRELEEELLALDLTDL